MSIPSRARIASAIQLSLSPPTSTPREAVPNQLHQFVIPRFVVQGSQESLGGDKSGVDLQSHRVLPLTALGVRSLQGLFEDGIDEDVQEDYSGIFPSLLNLL
jgi:hypothetical protein